MSERLAKLPIMADSVLGESLVWSGVVARVDPCELFVMLESRTLLAKVSVDPEVDMPMLSFLAGLIESDRTEYGRRRDSARLLEVWETRVADRCRETTGAAGVGKDCRMEVMAGVIGVSMTSIGEVTGTSVEIAVNTRGLGTGGA
jgi:hypothetical protein